MYRFYGKATETQRRPRRRRLRVVRSRAATIEVLRTWLGKWRENDAGVSAVEFALFAPVLFFALVAVADVGLAEYERMTIDHVLRAGAQSAMADQGQDQVLNVVQNTASKNLVLSNQTTPNAGVLTVSVNRFCTCPDNTSTAIACSTTCTGSIPTFIYYRLSGTEIYDGMIMPAMTLSSSVQVQVR